MKIQWSNEWVRWQFERQRSSIGVTEITGSDFLIAVSMRNPKFSNDWLDEVLAGIRRWRGRALITLVDVPYLASIEVLSTDDRSKREALRIYERQRSEQATRLERIAAQNEDISDYISWDTLLSLSSVELATELHAAFRRRGLVYGLVLGQVRRLFVDLEDEARLENLAQFFLLEVPTLLHLYYQLAEGCIDVYPGDQASFFWELDCGRLVDELPTASQVVARARPHTYARVDWMCA